MFWFLFFKGSLLGFISTSNGDATVPTDSTERSSSKRDDGTTGRNERWQEKVSGRGRWNKAKQNNREWKGENDECKEGGWEKGKRGWRKGRGSGGWTRGRGGRKKTLQFDQVDAEMPPDFVQQQKKSFVKTYNKVNHTSGDYTQPDQKIRGNKPFSLFLHNIYYIHRFCN